MEGGANVCSGYGDMTYGHSWYGAEAWNSYPMEGYEPTIISAGCALCLVDQLLRKRHHKRLPTLRTLPYFL